MNKHAGSVIESLEGEKTTGDNGTKKLLCLGLSDPEKGIADAIAAMNHPHTPRSAIRLVGGDVDAILGGAETQDGYNEYLGSALLLSDSDKSKKAVFKNNLSVNIGLHISNWQGYYFSHGAVRARGIKEPLSCVLIDDDAIQETINTLGPLGLEKFGKLEKGLGTLYSYANHDYTCHKFGVDLVVGGKYDVNGHLKNKITKTNYKYASSMELLAGMFHRDIISELGESGNNIIESIEFQSQRILEIIDNIEDRDLQTYWLKVFKYPFFSLINLSQNNANGENIIVKLQRLFPRLNIGINGWGESIGRNTVEIEGININLRELRIHVLDAMQRDNVEKLTTFLKSKGVKDTYIMDGSSASRMF